MKARCSLFVILSVLIFMLAAPPALAAPLAAPAIDGDGLMAVLPTSLTYGTGATVFTFTFTANNDFGAGSQVDLTIPAGWTAPTTASGAGHVGVSAGTCTLSGAPPYAVAGRDIFVDMASCATGHSFTITYNGTAPGVPGSPFTFATQTDIGTGGAGLVPITAGSPTITVLPKALTVTGGLVPPSKIYNGSTAAGPLTIGSPTLSGVISPDSVSLITAGAIGTFNNRNAGNSKAVTISGLTLSGAQAGNYSITPPIRTANITRRPLTITGVTDSKVYDGTTSSVGIPSITSGVVQPGDTEPAWEQTFDSRNAGPVKTLTPDRKINDGNSGNNYSYTYLTAVGTITKKPIAVTAVPNTRSYNGTLMAAAIPTNSGVATGDTAAFIESYSDKNIGTGKLLTTSGLVNDANGGNNYSYTYGTDTTGVILAKALSVSAAGLTPAGKTYNGTTAVTSLTIGSPTLVGVVSPDVVTLVTSGAVAAFADKNAGAAKLVNISGLTLGGAGASNYTLTPPTRTASIAKKPITATAVTNSKTYDGTVGASAVPTNSAVAVGDTANFSEAYSTRHFGINNKTLIPSGTVTDGNGGSNYAYTFNNFTTGTINKMPITVNAVTNTRVYDGTLSAAAIPTNSGVAAGDTAAFTEVYNVKDVGTGRTLTPTGVVADGNSGNNYAYTPVPDTTGVITVRSITVSAVTDSKTYDGTSNSSGVPNIAPPLGGTDTAAFTQSFNDKNVGTGKTLTATGTVNDGNGGADYSITFAPDVNGVILAKPITVTADAQTKALGALDPALTYKSNPPLFAPDIFLGNLTRLVGETYGTYAITQNTLSAGSNYVITYIGANLLIGPAISGNAGTAGAVLSYTDGTLKTVTADGTGLYSLIVSNNWSGTVTPSRAGFGFSPASKPYSKVTADVTAQNYAAIPLTTVSYRSAGAYDGWILESSRTSNVGGTLDSAGVTFNLGDDVANKQYRVVLSFDTSPLLPTAVVQSAVIKIRQSGAPVGANPFTVLGNLMVDVRKPFFGTAAALQLGDFSAAASAPRVGAFGRTPALGWYSVTLNSLGRSNINNAGPTQFRLYFSLGDNNNRLANMMRFFSGNVASAASRPVLTLQYYVP